MLVRRFAASCVVALAASTAASAQGLGALAADTEAQRRTRGTAAPVFSNDNLPGQSRIDAALRTFVLNLEVYGRIGEVQSALHASRQRNPKLHRYLSSFDNVGATRPPMAEQAKEFIEIADALDRGNFTPFGYEVAVFALEQASVDAIRSDADLKAMDPARQARAAFAREHAQILANGRWADGERDRQLPRPRPQ